MLFKRAFDFLGNQNRRRNFAQKRGGKNRRRNPARKIVRQKNLRRIFRNRQTRVVRRGGEIHARNTPRKGVRRPRQNSRNSEPLALGKRARNTRTRTAKVERRRIRQRPRRPAQRPRRRKARRQIRGSRKILRRLEQQYLGRRKNARTAARRNVRDRRAERGVYGKNRQGRNRRSRRRRRPAQTPFHAPARRPRFALVRRRKGGRNNRENVRGTLRRDNAQARQTRVRRHSPAARIGFGHRRDARRIQARRKVRPLAFRRISGHLRNAVELFQKHNRQRGLRLRRAKNLLLCGRRKAVALLVPRRQQKALRRSEAAVQRRRRARLRRRTARDFVEVGRERNSGGQLVFRRPVGTRAVLFASRRRGICVNLHSACFGGKHGRQKAEAVACETRAHRLFRQRQRSRLRRAVRSRVRNRQKREPRKDGQNVRNPRPQKRHG